MAHIAIAGLYNLETNLQITGFPLAYEPVHYPFYGVTQCHAGVGYNLHVALTRLGNQTQLASLIADDAAGLQFRQVLVNQHGSDRFIHSTLTATAQSVILVAPDGSRQIHCDLKDIQQQLYPAADTEALLAKQDLLIACNINFARPLLAAAKQRQLPIATDVHVLNNFDDDYNRDFLAQADIVFMSHEALPCAVDDAIRALKARYSLPILVISLGAQGAVLAETGQPNRYIAAQNPRPVLNTIGAGDALLAAFLDQYLQHRQAELALSRAVYYAGWKIGERGATAGLLTQTEFAQLYQGSA